MFSKISGTSQIIKLLSPILENIYELFPVGWGWKPFKNLWLIYLFHTIFIIFLTDLLIDGHHAPEQWIQICKYAVKS